MLISFSRHGSDPKGPAAQDAVSYMSAPEIRKPAATGPRLFRRDPPPEILRGDPAMARAAIRLAPGALKYRSAVLSFAAEDIDTPQFNAGDPALRGAVNLALALCLEIGFAGVPVRFSASPTADVP